MKNFSKILALPIVAIGGSALFINSANATLSQSVIDNICSYNETVRDFDIDDKGNSFVMFTKEDYDSSGNYNGTPNFLVKNGQKVGTKYDSPSNSSTDISGPYFPFYKIKDGKVYDGEGGREDDIAEVYIDWVLSKYDKNTMPRSTWGERPDINHTIKDGKVYKITLDDHGDVTSETFVKDLWNNITFNRAVDADNGHVLKVNTNLDVLYIITEEQNGKLVSYLYRNNERLSEAHPDDMFAEIITENADIYQAIAQWDKILIKKNGQVLANYDINPNIEHPRMTIDGNDIYIYFGAELSWHPRELWKWVEGIYKNGKPLCEKVATPHPLEEKIAKLPTFNTVTLADEAKITEIKKEFDALSAEDKKKISAENQKKLNDLIAKIAELKKKKEEAEKKNNSGNSGNNSNNSNNSSSSSSGGSGGGGAVYNTPNTPSNLNLTTNIESTKIKAPKTENSTKLFPKFIAKKEQTVKDLRDTKLADLNKRFGITNEKTRNEALSRGEFLKIVLDSANVNVSSI